MAMRRNGPSVAIPRHKDWNLYEFFRLNIDPGIFLLEVGSTTYGLLLGRVLLAKRLELKLKEVATIFRNVSLDQLGSVYEKMYDVVLFNWTLPWDEHLQSRLEEAARTSKRYVIIQQYVYEPEKSPELRSPEEWITVLEAHVGPVAVALMHQEQAPEDLGARMLFVVDLEAKATRAPAVSQPPEGPSVLNSEPPAAPED